jgi:two-component system sensor histidine kinase ResE
MTTTTAAPKLAEDPLRDLLIHDIRTPLAAISGYVQLLLRRAVNDSPDIAGLADSLRRIEQAATRVGHLLDELSDSFPPPAAEETDRQRERIDLIQVAGHVAAECEAAALRKSRVVVLPAASELLGWWNSAGLERVLANLIDNALKYNRDDGSVVVSISDLDGWAVISVADQGVGIPAADLPSVFERGYRASNVARHWSGSGLGLAGAHEIVAAHGGTISLQSQLGSGTTATVRLPLGGPTR